MAKFTTSVFLLLLAFAYAEYEMILPPIAGSNVTLVGIAPYCPDHYCKVIVAYQSGEIYSIDLMANAFYPVHLSGLLTSKLRNSGSTYTSNISCIGISGEQHTLYVQAVNSIYYTNLAQDEFRDWATVSIDNKAVFLIPLNNEESTDVVVVYNNTYVVIKNLIYGNGTVLGNYISGLPTAVLLTDLIIENSSGISSRKIVAVGTSYGQVTLCTQIGDVITSTSTGVPTFGKINTILHYRSGTVQLLICNQYNNTYRENNRIIVIDAISQQEVVTWPIIANQMVILSDSYLNDWLIYSNASGIFRVSMNNLTSVRPNPESITPNVWSSTSSKTIDNILSLQVNYFIDRDEYTGLKVIIPCVVAITSVGSVAVFDSIRNTWKLIADPFDFLDNGNLIQSASIIKTNNDLNSYILFVVMDDGAIVTNELQSAITFTSGTPSIESDRHLFEIEVERVIPITLSLEGLAADAISVSTLSNNQLYSLLQQQQSVILQFQNDDGDSIDYQLVGYEKPTGSNRDDSPSLKLKLVNTVNTTLTLEKHGLKIWGAIISGIFTAANYIGIGLKIFDEAKTFYYSATKILNSNSEELIQMRQGQI